VPGTAPRARRLSTSSAHTGGRQQPAREFAAECRRRCPVRLQRQAIGPGVEIANAHEHRRAPCHRPAMNGRLHQRNTPSSHARMEKSTKRCAGSEAGLARVRGERPAGVSAAPMATACGTADWLAKSLALRSGTFRSQHAREQQSVSSQSVLADTEGCVQQRQAGSGRRCRPSRYPREVKYTVPIMRNARPHNARGHRSRSCSPQSRSISWRVESRSCTAAAQSSPVGPSSDPSARLTSPPPRQPGAIPQNGTRPAQSADQYRHPGPWPRRRRRPMRNGLRPASREKVPLREKSPIF
jgi:hypothetical protein